jgi:acetate kinase
MYCLSINYGSSTIKVGLYQQIENGITEVEKQSMESNHESLLHFIESLISTYSLQQHNLVFGIRIVHGGASLTTPTRITPDVVEYLQSISSLAPLHNPPAIEIVKILLNHYPSHSIIAVFDTMFHSQLPEVASTYAVPPSLTNIGVRRYGFHGLAYSSVVRIFSQQMNIQTNSVNVIALHLGSGCSMSLIQQGVSIDTSMGFSPLEGLISRTRSGDIDPAVIPFLTEKLGKNEKEIVSLLNHESGLAGISNTDGHLSSLYNEMDEQKQKALDAFIYRIQKYIGAYDVVAQRKLPLVFSGGMSEHGEGFIKQLFMNLFLDVQIDASYIHHVTKPLTRISTDISKRHVYLAYINEEFEIAHQVMSH